MNFSYLTALFNWKRTSIPKGKTYALGLKILLTFVGIVATFVFLEKIYEVPVNYTNICIRYNTDSISASIKIIRDFDLRSHISRDTTSSEWKYGEHTGRLFLSGYGYTKRKDSIVHVKHGNISVSMENTLRDKLAAQLKNKGEFNFIDSVHNLIYTRIGGTKRQFFKVWTSVSEPIFEPYKSCKDGEGRDSILQHWYSIYSTIHNNRPHNIFISENLRSSGIVDDTTFFKNDYSATSLDKPNFFITAEDFSKLVEEIRLDSIGSKEIHRLDIDYKGAAEFGFLRPAPDSMTISSIHYSNPEKIDQIAKDGLKYQVRFPELENMQEIRIFFATMLLAGLLGVFFNLLYRLLRPWGLRVWKNKSKSIISWTILISIFLLFLIVYFVYISRPAHFNMEENELVPFTEIGQ